MRYEMDTAPGACKIVRLAFSWKLAMLPVR
jgi:hypothetical protein